MPATPYICKAAWPFLASVVAQYPRTAPLRCRDPLRPTHHPLASPGVAAEWQALKAHAHASFFQSWTWVGCLTPERFADPVLLCAEHGGALVGLALLNRRGSRLWLGESGEAALDAVYVEHNGPLLARGHANVLARCLRTLLQHGRVVLSGVDDAHLAAARAVGAVRLRRSALAPWLDLSRLGPGEDAFLTSLSANTRQQLRRSDRSYAASGPVSVRRAADTWQRRAGGAAPGALDRTRPARRVRQPGLPALPPRPAGARGAARRGRAAARVGRRYGHRLPVQFPPSRPRAGLPVRLRLRGRRAARQAGPDLPPRRHRLCLAGGNGGLRPPGRQRSLQDQLGKRRRHAALAGTGAALGASRAAVPARPG